ncbi:hypothetical protein GQ457_05G013760 [Hibiscus cannabinus]
MTEFMSVKKVTYMSTKGTKEMSKSWTPPESGIIKLNCDAAFDKISGCATTAVIARDSSSCLIGGISSSFLATSASSAEAYAIRLGAILAKEKGYANVIFESNNLGVINRLKSNCFTAWESAAVEEDILNLCLNFSSYSFSFIHRSGNVAADWVVKAVMNFSCPDDWVFDAPLGLRKLLYV